LVLLVSPKVRLASGACSAVALLIAAKRSDGIASELAVHTENNTEDLEGLVNDNTVLTKQVRATAEEVRRHTELLDEIHRHVAALSPQAGRFPPDQPPPSTTD
jgi:hypothetical protein